MKKQVAFLELRAAGEVQRVGYRIVGRGLPPIRHDHSLLSVVIDDSARDVIIPFQREYQLIVAVSDRSHG